MAFAQHVVDRLAGPRAPARRPADAQRGGRKRSRSASLRLVGFPARPPARQPPRLSRQVGERRFERGEAKPQGRGPTPASGSSDRGAGGGGGAATVGGPQKVRMRGIPAGAARTRRANRCFGSNSRKAGIRSQAPARPCPAKAKLPAAGAASTRPRAAITINRRAAASAGLSIAKAALRRRRAMRWSWPDSSAAIAATTARRASRLRLMARGQCMGKR